MNKTHHNYDLKTRLFLIQTLIYDFLWDIQTICLNWSAFYGKNQMKKNKFFQLKVRSNIKNLNKQKLIGIWRRLFPPRHLALYAKVF